jgi:hypothetical protein
MSIEQPGLDRDPEVRIAGAVACRGADGEVRPECWHGTLKREEVGPPAWVCPGRHPNADLALHCASTRAFGHEVHVGDDDGQRHLEGLVLVRAGVEIPG